MARSSFRSPAAASADESLRVTLLQMGNLLVGEEVLPERFLDDFTRLLRRYRVPVNESFPVIL